MEHQNHNVVEVQNVNTSMSSALPPSMIRICQISDKVPAINIYKMASDITLTKPSTLNKYYRLD